MKPGAISVFKSETAGCAPGTEFAPAEFATYDWVIKSPARGYEYTLYAESEYNQQRYQIE